MKIRIYILVSIFFGVTNHSCAQWQTVYKDSSQFQFNTVHFLNSDTGFVGGYDFTSFSNNGIMFRTMDGGLTWDTTKLSELIICVTFIDSTFGFCGGDGGANYLTTDIGETWQKRGYSTTMADHSSIYFLNPSVGYRSTMQSWIQQTTDTGMTWQNIFNSIGGSYFPGTSRMLFIDSLTGYLAQSRFGQTPIPIKSISKTIDGGNIWNDLLIPANFYPYSCFFFDSLSGFAVGRYGEVSNTADGGINWSIPVSISNYALYDIAFVNDSIGYIVGGYYLYDHPSSRKGIIFKTIDYGTSWQVIDSSYFDVLVKLHFPNDSVGYAVGINGIILKITDANSVFTNVHSLITLQNFSIYPNPAQNFIYLDKTVNEKIYILNTIGSVVKIAEAVNMPDKKLYVDISSLVSGIYFVRNGALTTKFLKID